MKLHKRLERLEKQFISEPTVLTMLDGRTETIEGPKKHLFDLFGIAVGRKPETPQQSKHLDLIAECVRSKEPGGARMAELIQCFFHGPVETPTEVAIEPAGNVGPSLDATGP